MRISVFSGIWFDSGYRAENCGAPQHLQFVDQVESPLSGNRDMFAQCELCSFQLSLALDS